MGCEHSDLRQGDNLQQNPQGTNAPGAQSSSPNAHQQPQPQQPRQPAPVPASANRDASAPPPAQQRQQGRHEVPEALPASTVAAPPSSANGQGMAAAPNAPQQQVGQQKLQHPQQRQVQPPAQTQQRGRRLGQRAAHSRTRVDPKSGIPPLPSVPLNSWYAAPFYEGTDVEMADFYYENKGRVVFSNRVVPTLKQELDQLPIPGVPHTQDTFEVGADLVYGMGCLHNTALFIEHLWRGRVAHLEKVRAGTVEIPPQIKMRQEQLAAQAKCQGTEGGTLAATASNELAKKAAVGLPLLRDETSIYKHPFFDMLIGIKLFVDNELVPDHYPAVRSLPQCTATLDAAEAVNRWLCIPFVLIGYLNHPTLDSISLYRTLSLNFAEHMLHIKSKQPAEASANADRRKGPGYTLRVEVVYGCRSEAYFCTEFLARGSCTLLMTERSKPALKAYEEQLRALIQAKRSSEQLIRIAPSDTSRPRVCAACANLLLFRCTVCGAELCGSLICERQRVIGYPCGCSLHKGQLLK